MNMFTLLLLCAIGTDGLNSVSYRSAYYDSALGNKPMLVVIGASWCGACNDEKNIISPAVAKEGKLTDVNVVLLDIDIPDEAELARQFMSGSSIPQTILFKNERGKWIRRAHSGKVNRSVILDLIRK